MGFSRNNWGRMNRMLRSWGSEAVLTLVRGCRYCGMWHRSRKLWGVVHSMQIKNSPKKYNLTLKRWKVHLRLKALERRWLTYKSFALIISTKKQRGINGSVTTIKSHLWLIPQNQSINKDCLKGWLWRINKDLNYPSIALRIKITRTLKSNSKRLLKGASNDW